LDNFRRDFQCLNRKIRKMNVNWFNWVWNWWRNKFQNFKKTADLGTEMKLLDQQKKIWNHFFLLEKEYLMKFESFLLLVVHWSDLNADFQLKVGYFVEIIFHSFFWDVQFKTSLNQINHDQNHHQLYLEIIPLILCKQH
jgi:hypothetical protein